MNQNFCNIAVKIEQMQQIDTIQIDNMDEDVSKLRHFSFDFFESILIPNLHSVRRYSFEKLRE